MEKRRHLMSQIALALDALICGAWAYMAVSRMLQSMSTSGSGGIGGVSVGGGLVESLITVVPPIVTLSLARASGSTLAKYWRSAHIVALLALIILPMMGGLRAILVSIVIRLPVQVFFVVGAVAIWFDRPRHRPGTPSEAPT